MNKCVKITFQPIIWRDENLNNASAGIGSTICHVFGETKEQLFENIKQKIWAMSSEARILDEEVAAEYNQWIADSWKAKSIPAEIKNMGMRDMRYALPYSKEFKQWLRKHN
jgi:hypothetical protein